MRNFAKAVALSAILGGALLASPAQAQWGNNWGSPWGGGGPWSGGPWGGSPWGGGWPGSRSNMMDDWMDGTGWGDMNFSTSTGGRGYGRGYGRDNYGYGPYGYGGGYPYGGGYAPYGGGYGGYPGGGYGGYPGGGYGPNPGYNAPPAPPAPSNGPSNGE